MSQSNLLQELSLNQANKPERMPNLHIRSSSTITMSPTSGQKFIEDATFETENKPTNNDNNNMSSSSHNNHRQLHSRSTSLIVNPRFDPTLQDVYKRSSKNPLPRQRRSLQSLNNSRAFNVTADKRLRLDSSGQELEERGNHLHANYEPLDDAWRWKQQYRYEEQQQPQQQQTTCATIPEPVSGDDECAFESDSSESSATPTPTIVLSKTDEQIVTNDILDRELAVELVEAGLFELPPGYPAQPLSMSRQNLLQFRLTGLYLRKISQDFIKSRRRTI